ncbi:MAG TPA: hypothetical protein ENI74_05795, partial [Gammaproteobacteria bacterium]|nr:hypothetical protein [Gammaproteobacteria bacterium]
AAQRFSFDESPAGPGYQEFVSAMSRAVAALSQQIAERIGKTTSGCQ